MGKVRYKVRNWREYNKALKDRYCITLWISEEEAAVWWAEATGTRGAPRTYSDAAIECCLTIRVLLRLPLRGSEGFLRSVLPLLDLPELAVPDYSTLSRRGKYLEVKLPVAPKEKGVHLVVDSTGMKIYGEGEWKVRLHGVGKRRTWRKVHIGLDEGSGEILAAAVTTADVSDGEVLPGMLREVDLPVAKVIGDGAYDRREDYDAIASLGAQAVIPARRGARIWRHGKCRGAPHVRDEHIRRIRAVGRKRWKRESGYSRRSLAETAFSRTKRLFGDRLRSRLFENQAVEAFLGLRALNIMTALGMPVSVAIP
jgi:transposase